MGAGAQAHMVGCTGKPVPDEIRASCCGKADAHQIPPEDLTHDEDAHVWHVKGIGQPIPDARAEPSPDGCYWVFMAVPLGSAEAMSGNMSIYCFFVPMDL